MDRRTSLIRLGMGVTGLSLAGDGAWFPTTALAATAFTSRRPPVAGRHFVSDAVESTITATSALIRDEELRWMFANCFPNTLDTTVRHTTKRARPDTFVITGDIDAMWLRDSTAQVWPYVPLASSDERLRAMIAGVVHRQTECILIDPYANAFNDGPGHSEWASDLTAMKPELHERKWEIDSLCYPVRLAHGYWKATGDTSVFTERWRDAAALIVKTFREQQRLQSPGPYRFQRRTPVASDSLPLSGYGNPTKKVGLIHSMFRSSDDACVFPFLVPSNYFAVTTLRQLGDLAVAGHLDSGLGAQCRAFADEVEAALRAHAVVTHPRFGRILAFEVDGYGSALLMDDGNVPSLLALPYLGSMAASDELYRNTRAFVLSDANPYYYEGAAGQGIGGPHAGIEMIWPLAITMRGLTSSDPTEQHACLAMLKRTHAGTGFMHESFHKDDASKFTRAWFAWANTLFGEFVLHVARTSPQVLQLPL